LYFNTASSTWKSTDTATSTGIFIRKYCLSDVKRLSSTGDISTSTSAVLDSSTKKVTVSVSWKGKNGTTTKSLSTYITNVTND